MTETTKPLIRVLIVDDHEIVREGLHTLLSEESTIELVGQAADGLEAVTMANKHRPDVILMDLVMPNMDGIEATRQILTAVPNSRILILTSFAEDKRVHDAIQAGATGYLLKDTLRPELLRAITAAAEGKPTLHPEAQQALIRQATAPKTAPLHEELTAREYDVLAQIGRGKNNREIATVLHLTEGTVKGYVSSILSKLDVADRTQAALYAVKHGLVGDP
jgi:DNA-binding NarL/FixJ family response regulator